MTTPADDALAALHELTCIGDIVEALGAGGTPHDPENVPGSVVEWLGQQIVAAAGRANAAVLALRDGAAQLPLRVVPRG